MNIEKIRQSMAWVEAEHEKQMRGEPSEWDQGHWICETVMCIAGQRCIADGCIPLPGAFHSIKAPDGSVVGSSGFAQKSFGLTDYQAEEFFSGGNSIDDMRRIVAEFEAIHAAETQQ